VQNERSLNAPEHNGQERVLDEDVEKPFAERVVLRGEAGLPGATVGRMWRARDDGATHHRRA
jgi:hypothetical protein